MLILIKQTFLSGRPMKKAPLFLLLIFLALSLSAENSLNDNPALLILYSYHPGNDWEDAVHHALMDELKKSVPGARLYVEYLDTKRFAPSDRVGANLKSLEEYRERPLSLIVAVDDNALSFLSGPASDFRTDLPVVFCGVGDYASLKESVNHPHTGVLSRISLADTLDLAFRLKPGLKKVYVVADATPTGKAVEQMVREQASQLRGTLRSLDFIYCESDSLSTDELLSKSATLESDTVMLFVIWGRDGQGRYISEKEFLARLKGRTSVPVFNLLHKRPGILGGRVTSGDLQAFYAVKQIVDILSGTSASAIAIRDVGVTSYVIDADRMVYWNLSMEELPSGTELLGNIPEKPEILSKAIVLSIILASTVLSIVLFIRLRFSRRSLDHLHWQKNVMTTLLESVEDAVVLCDVSGRILKINAAAARISGWSGKDALFRPVGEIFPLEHEYSKLKLSHPIDMILSGEREDVPYGSMVLIRRNGKKVPIDGRAIVLRSSEGQGVEGALFLFSDVSHVEKIQEILYSEQRRLRDAQAMAMIGNWEYNPELDEYWYSREVYTLTRTDPAQDPPPPVLDFMRQFFPDWHRHKSLPESLTEGGTRIKSLVTIPRKDGGNTILHLMARIARNPENGKMIITGILQDFSELSEARAALKSSQEQLRQSARMEAVGKLAGGIAHEFNNLLQIILGYGQLLTDEVDSEKLRSYVEPILKTAASARNLTRQLLLFSRKENLDMKPMTFSSLVRGMLPLLSRLIGEDIQLKHNLESGEDWIIGDSHQLEQVIINLCLNGRDAMPEGGTLELFQDIQTFVLPHPGVDGLIPSGSYVHFSVKDNGKGIDEEVLPQIFDPFFTTKQQDQGTGLGLSLVYGIIRQHKGFLNIETNRSRGSVFHLYLPRENMAPEVEKKLREDSDSFSSSSGMVFMAEDDPMVRQLTETMLRKNGFHIQSFISGKELIAALEQSRNRGDSGKNTIDLFLLDVIMPEVGGVEAFHKLRSMGYDRPVLFMSGYTEEKLKNLKDLENASLIRKPFTMKDLVRKVQEMIDSVN